VREAGYGMLNEYRRVLVMPGAVKTVITACVLPSVRGDRQDALAGRLRLEIIAAIGEQVALAR
jgi:hypothetical protein